MHNTHNASLSTDFILTAGLFKYETMFRNLSEILKLWIRDII